MGSTVRFGLPFPELTDAPNGPMALQGLAESTEAWLARAIPCTSDNRPTAPPVGMLISETDTGLWLGWTGAAWEPLAAGAAGGGEVGAAVGEAQYSASGQQSISSSDTTLRVVAFGTADITSPDITRAVRGSGHEFTLARGGRWALDVTVRWATSGTDGERYAALLSSAAPTTPILQVGGPWAAEASSGDDVPIVQHFSGIRRFTAGATLFVGVRQNTDQGQQLDPGSGHGVRIAFTLLGP
jgi:hypothetical protein